MKLSRKCFYIFLKITQNSFILMGFKNHIKQIVAIVGNFHGILPTIFMEVLHHSQGHLIQNGVNFLSYPFQDWGQCLKTLSPQGYLKEKVVRLASSEENVSTLQIQTCEKGQMWRKKLVWNIRGHKREPDSYWKNSLRTKCLDWFLTMPLLLEPDWMAVETFVSDRFSGFALETIWTWNS